MGQQDNDFTGDYLDTLENPSAGDATQDGTLPLPTTDENSHSALQVPDVTEHITDSTDSILRESYKATGEAAATRDFQQAHGEGWEYNADAMKKQIEKLEHLRDGPLKKIETQSDVVVDIESPADEEISNSFVEAANDSGRSHNDQFKKYKAYIDAYIETLYKIDKAYQNQDEDAAQEILSKEI